MNKNKIDWTEAEEIAASFLNIETDNSDVIEQALIDKHDISMEVFHEICNHLFSIMDFAISPLTNKPMIGFGTGSEWLAKKEITSRFISGVIQWTSEGEDFEGVKGYKRDITCDGKPEYEITIKKHPLKEKNDEQK